MRSDPNLLPHLLSPDSSNRSSQGRRSSYTARDLVEIFVRVVGVTLIMVGLVGWFAGEPTTRATSTVETVKVKAKNQETMRVTSSQAPHGGGWPRDTVFTLALVGIGSALLVLTLRGVAFRVEAPGGGVLELSRAELAAKASVAVIEQAVDELPGSPDDLRRALMEAYGAVGLIGRPDSPSLNRTQPSDEEIAEIGKRVAKTL